MRASCLEQRQKKHLIEGLTISLISNSKFIARLFDWSGWGAWPDWPPLGSATDPIHCVHACMRAGGGGFELRKRSTKVSK